MFNPLSRTLTPRPLRLLVHILEFFQSSGQRRSCRASLEVADHPSVDNGREVAPNDADG
jgi:hypothetical protein